MERVARAGRRGDRQIPRESTDAQFRRAGPDRFERRRRCAAASRDGLFPGARPPTGNILEFRDVVLDHLHPRGRSDFVSPRAFAAWAVHRSGWAGRWSCLFALAVAATMGQLASDVSDGRRPLPLGVDPRAAADGAGRRPGSTWRGWSPCWPRSTSGLTDSRSGALGFPGGLLRAIDLPAQRSAWS